MKTIAERWARFDAIVLRADVPATHRTEMRRAFYAGFHEALMAAVELADESGSDDNLGVVLIQQLHDECLRFASDIQAGKA